MLTRFQVSGFKNLVDVDIRLGAFTCIAGANGVGKSNLFDALRFLSMTANTPLIEAALAVRGSESGQNAISNMFTRYSSSQSRELSFHICLDKATYSSSSWRVISSLAALSAIEPLQIKDVDYRIDIAFYNEPRNSMLGIVSESFVVNKLSLIETIPPPSARIEMLSSPPVKKMATVQVNSQLEDVKPRTRVLGNTPFTTLATIASNADFYPAAAILQSEMTNWRVLQLQSSVLGRPDDFTTPEFLTDDGAHMAATIHRIANKYRNDNNEPDPERLYSLAASRLNELIGDVQTIRIDEDDKRELYTLYLKDHNGTEYPARSLSDGTLRFLALITLWLDPEATGIFCIEEPENGIHPSRLPALVRLLQDIAVDPEAAEDYKSPSRQVIVVTHSPDLVKLVPEDSLLLARNREAVTEEGTRYSRAEFVPLAGTWRVTEETPATAVASRNELLAYLNPSVLSAYDNEGEFDDDSSRRVMDRDDLRPILSLNRK